METHDKEVYFSEYCPLCQYEMLGGDEDPCNACLDYPCNIDSHKPINFKEKN